MSRPNGAQREALKTWTAWYRFARRAFDYPHGEAVLYANVRLVEEMNRRRSSSSI